jgi:hypothetical protein
MRYGPHDATEMMGIGSYVGEVRRGPDGQVYQWVEGVDGLGNAIGFWSALKKIGQQVLSKAGSIAKFIPGVQMIRGPVQQFCNALPALQPVANLHPGIGPVAQVGGKLCQVLRKVGLAGMDGEIMEAPDGQLYEVVATPTATPTQAQQRPGRRRVWISIPAVIHRSHGPHARPAGQVVTPVIPGAQPAAPGAQPVTAAPARPVRRFR